MSYNVHQWYPTLLFLLYLVSILLQGFPDGSDGKESACSEGDLGQITGSGRSPGEGHGNPLQYSCLKNPMDRLDSQNLILFNGLYSISIIYYKAQVVLNLDNDRNFNKIIKSGCQVCSLLLLCHCLQALSADKAKKCIYLYINRHN